MHVRQRRLRLAGLLVGSLAAAMVLAPVAAADTTPFPQEDERQAFTVPAGVCSITIDAFGAQGGDADNNSGPGDIIGGLGAHVTTTISVTPGEVLGVFVGGEGGFGFAGNNTGGAAGFNGAGVGGTASNIIGGGSGGAGGGGGGASDVRQIPGGTGCVPCVTPTPGTGTEAAIVVAGGGGGAGNNSLNGPAGNGGAGGGAPGGDPNGNGNNGDGPGGGGGGGAAAGGGTGGNNNGTATGAGGGGGGGVTVGGGGGGGGAAVSGGGGGGGGSSVVTAPGATGTVLLAGVQSDDGSVVFTYTVTGLPTCSTSPATAFTSEDINFAG